MNYNVINDNKQQLNFYCKQICLKFMLKLLKVSIQASLSSIVKTEDTMNFLMKGQATLFGNTSFALNLPEYYKTWVTQACNSVSLPVQVAIIA